MSLLSVENLTVRFKTDEGLITVVEDVSFHISQGEVLGARRKMQFLFWLR
mgnify:CR=1 FL=1